MNLRRTVRPEIKRFAKELRKRQTHYEEILWQKIRCKRFLGVRWRRQSVIRGYILDFYCPTFRIGVEVDGPIHDPQRDAIRDANILRGTGIRILRFSNDAVQNEISEVLQSITDEVEKLGFSTNPQAQQQQSIDNLKYKDCSDERCVNVGKVAKLVGCQRQVFVDQEVAESTARSLLAVGILAVPEVCGKCRRVHLRENRHNTMMNRAAIHSLKPRFA